MNIWEIGREKELESFADHESKEQLEVQASSLARVLLLGFRLNLLSCDFTVT